MEITRTMDLAQLAERMGAEATIDEARRMRDLLVAEHDGESTDDIDEIQWIRMLDRAIVLDGEN